MVFIILLRKSPSKVPEDVPKRAAASGERRSLPLSRLATNSRSFAMHASGKVHSFGFSRWSRRSRWCLRRYRAIHVVLNFDSVQRSIVSPYLVYAPRKILTVNTVPADFQRVRRDRDLPSLRTTAHLHSVHIQSHCCPIIRPSQVRPSVGCQLSCSKKRLANRTACRWFGTRAVGCQIVIVVALVDHVTPNAGQSVWINPGFECHSGS